MVTDDVLSRIAGEDEANAGLVTHAVGGLCKVITRSGERFECTPRGRIKKDGIRILPGDVVRIERLGPDEAVIEEVLPRQSLLQRPYIANVDQVVLVSALAEPEPNLDFLDRLLVAVHRAGLDTLIVWNKADLVPEHVAEEYRSLYTKAGYATVVTSPKKDVGRDELMAGLKGHLTVLAGASGAGKSSLLNWILREERFATGSVSHRLQRGRHTTRSVELVPLETGGWIADSPGFSVIDLTSIPKAELAETYPDMQPLAGLCRFVGCLHRDEPDCRVQEAVVSGEFDKGRYERYLRILGELEEFERRRYR